MMARARQTQGMQALCRRPHTSERTRTGCYSDRRGDSAWKKRRREGKAAGTPGYSSPLAGPLGKVLRGTDAGPKSATTIWCQVRTGGKNRALLT